MNTERRAATEPGLQQRLHQQTAQIAWRELQRFFAQGKVLQVDPGLDLVRVAIAIAKDDTATLKPLLAQQKVAAPDDDQARHWYKSDSVLWSVVVAPYVLVQERTEL